MWRYTLVGWPDILIRNATAQEGLRPKVILAVAPLVNFHGKQDSCRTVPQVVEAHVRQADAYQKPPENLPQGASAIEVALRIGKYQIFLNPGASELPCIDHLSPPQKCFNGQSEPEGRTMTRITLSPNAPMMTLNERLAQI